VTEVEVSLSTVVEHVNFAVLEGTHGAGVDIEIGIELLESYFQATLLEDSAEGGGGESFA
jgi:hypothetical protein